MRPLPTRVIRLLPEIMDHFKPGQYTDWSKADLISRLTTIERAYVKLRNNTSPQTSQEHPIYPYSSHARRKIALKFCYAGWVYGGLAAQNDETPLPTVEQVLFDALVKTRLIDSRSGFEGCGWERCGRTDRTVSAAGQVVSLWVRSATQVSAPREAEHADFPDSANHFWEEKEKPTLQDTSLTPSQPSEKTLESPSPELPYIALLNRVLPSTIRVIAWSPVDEAFSARFDCQYRHYKYFFSAEHLSIPQMRVAASYLVGKHDFRNLCKIDATKQIRDFRRRILRADILPVPDEISGGGKIWVFNLIGRAFLYHQVRHIMAILMLVGAGLEEPLILKRLMHVEAPHLEHTVYPDEEIEEDDNPDSEEDDTLHNNETYPPLRNKPEYQMADGLPLMLWDCSYSNSSVSWRRDYDPQPDLVPPRYREVAVGLEPDLDASQNGRVTVNSDFFPPLHHLLSSELERSQVESALTAHFLYAGQLSGLYDSMAITFQPPASDHQPSVIPAPERRQTLNIPLGGGTSQRSANYIPIMARQRMATVEEINERWKKGKGARRVGKGKQIPKSSAAVHS